MDRKTVLTAIIGIIVGAGGVMAFEPKKEVMPVATSTEHQASNDSMMASLEEKRGEKFDREFIIQMIAHHEGAIQMAELALRTSERPEIRKLSTEIIAAQKMEIQKMQEWHQIWFGSKVSITSMGQ